MKEQERDWVMDASWTLMMLMVLCVCPLMYGYAGKPEDDVSCALLMRGWELICFSKAGAVPFALVPLFCFGRGVLGQMRVRAVLLAAGLTCYAYSFALMHDWLISVSDIPITYEYGAVVYPLVLTAAAMRTLGTALVKRNTQTE